jgi:hypothetical protein
VNAAAASATVEESSMTAWDERRPYVAGLAATASRRTGVYYEDLAHFVVRRATVILYLGVTRLKFIGERADVSPTAARVLETVLERLE